MTTKIIRVALHLVDFVLSSPALRCSVSGRGFLCMSGCFTPRGSLCSCSSQSWSLWLWSLGFTISVPIFTISGCTACFSPCRTFIPSKSDSFLQAFAFVLLSEFFQNNKNRKNLLKMHSYFIPMWVSDFRNSPCCFLEYFCNLIHSEFEWPIDFAWHPVFLRTYGRLSRNQ